jgi:hypothetical protein
MGRAHAAISPELAAVPTLGWAPDAHATTYNVKIQMRLLRATPQ